MTRWSAAKGISYIGSHLSENLNTEILEHILELLTENVYADKTGKESLESTSDSTWHGACLSLAELCRRGLVTPRLLPIVIDWGIKALGYDVRKGSYSVGANVRDSACYIFWALARSQSTQTMTQYGDKVAGALLVAALFDREVHVRRAASAAFQESVGRLVPNTY